MAMLNNQRVTSYLDVHQGFDGFWPIPEIEMIQIMGLGAFIFILVASGCTHVHQVLFGVCIDSNAVCSMYINTSKHDQIYVCVITYTHSTPLRRLMISRLPHHWLDIYILM